MSELPDVEINRRYLNATALHRRITAVRVGSEKNQIILEDIDPQRLGRAVIGQTMAETMRHGKYCFVVLSGGNHLVFHFDQTGYLRYYQNEPEDTEHIRVRFSFDNGYHLAFINQRLLGTVAMTADPQSYLRAKQLGPDALDGVSAEYFFNLLESSNAKIKALLMDQQKIAGIGNVYADEILFQARIHPATPANLLSRPQRDRLYENLRRVLAEAIQARADADKMPESYLLPTRAEGEKCPRCGRTLKKEMIQGRSSYYCPACQR